MLNAKHTKYKSKKLTIALLVLALLLCGALVFAYVHHTKNTSNTTATTTKQPKKLNPAITNKPNNDRKLASTQSNTLDSSSGTTPLSATIVSANVNNGNVHIGTLVNGTTSGSCTLTATQGDQNISLATADVQADVNNYDCGVFNIPTSNFPESGSWKLILTVESNGSSTTGTATVQIQ